MVFYFKARPEAGDYTIFMGLDKYENEELIKFGFPEDICVDSFLFYEQSGICTDSNTIFADYCNLADSVTKLMWDITEIVREVWGSNWANHIQLEASEGIVIMWDKWECDGEISSVGMYSVSNSCTGKNQDFSRHLNRVYAPNDIHEGEETWGKLVLLGGCVKDLGYSTDFNTLRHPSEKKICNRINKAVTAFSGFIEDMELVDLFHVDKMSSAHVYLRLNKGQTFDDIPEGVLEDCAQLVKANSIQGNKVNNVDVVYTPWQNLKKTASMDVGQVSFHNPKMVRTVRVEKRINEIVNRLNRTKVERKPDLKAEREAVNAAERAERKQQLREKKRREDMDRLEKERQAEMRSYKNLMVADKMTSNKDVASANKSLQEMEEDFM
ncbi:hypothetical protein H5410_042456 [Solanum commersonii]|uniref:NFACT RNA-binding domain-containing protein n=1 Tax=Solanum commersonii TaxID=4109 RepID=A0A9J5XYL6_SOLCO|nr:hypothetical protein H5410_042456 [Solanum commersonii]